jgi:hypothetical protein
LPFHEIPCLLRTDPQNKILVALTPRIDPQSKILVALTPRIDPQNKILVALTPRTKLEKNLKSKNWEKNQLFCHKNQQFFEGFEIPKTSGSLMDVFQIPKTD